MQRIFRTCIAPLALALCAIGAHAQEAAQYYRGKTLTFVVGFAVANGYDSYSRAVARHIGKHLPGNPQAVVQNMQGAASIIAANHIYNIAPKDGTVLGMVDQAMALTQVLGSPQLRADVTRFNWIGRISDNASVLYAWHTAPVQNIKEAFDKELIVSYPGENSRILFTFMQNQLGVKFRILTGYKGPNEARLAMEQGEVHGMAQPFPVLRSEKPDWLRDRKVNLLLQVAVDAHADLKGVPVVTDLARNDEEKMLIELVAGNSRIGRALLSPPGQPHERIADLRKAFMATMEDEGFKGDIAKLGLDLNPMSGEELQRFVTKSADIAPDLAARLRKLTGHKE